MVRTDIPPEWGSDALSEYLHAAHRNRIATFVNKASAYAQLSEIDNCFVTIAADWTNPPNLIAPLLFLRCHSSYRAACELALAGQAGDLYVQLRACLERAGYGLLIGKTPGLDLVWLNRHEDQPSMEASKKAFTLGAIRNAIAATDRDGAARFEKLYQLTIDFGAHPNERGVTGNLAIVKNEDNKQFLQIYMHADSPTLDHGLVTTARVGLCALETLQNLYTARFELLGVRERILNLRRGL